LSDTGPEPERTENAEGTEEPEATEEAAVTEDPDGLDDEGKRKFREALERKRSRETATGAGAGPGAGKVQGVHGPASSRRSFRRRGGG
jgi:hypothetical protein